MKTAVFGGDLFWSSIPYECLNVFHNLNSTLDCDLILFDKDIRLNKKFNGNEKYFFDVQQYKGVENLVTIKDWDEFYKISSNYDIILCSSKIAPKLRRPKDFRRRKRAAIGMWDVGGCDILTDAVQFADAFFTKGEIWTEWLNVMGWRGHTITTGCPHYDYFLDDASLHTGKPLGQEEFDVKYGLEPGEKRILILPTNPSSHTEYFNENLKYLEQLCTLAKDKNIKLLLKTYPHDYLFFEKESQYTGIYRRTHGANMPQYEFLKKEFDDLIVIESQDHFSAIKFSDVIFNISGSHVAWETFFTDSQCCSINYEGQKFYKNLSYLPSYITLPDQHVNFPLNSVEEMLGDFKNKKRLCDPYFLRSFSLDKINHYMRVMEYGFHRVPRRAIKAYTRAQIALKESRKIPK